jgi:hypothetical protein
MRHGNADVCLDECRHSEAQRAEAIQTFIAARLLDCFASLAMTKLAV